VQYWFGAGCSDRVPDFDAEGQRKTRGPQLPLKPGDGSATFYWIAGPQERTRDQVALIRLVTRDYFPTIGARLREGRFFEESDRRSDTQMAIVNETFANRNFAGRSAIGAQFSSAIPATRAIGTGSWAS
jgi:hypothetical protein